MDSAIILKILEYLAPVVTVIMGGLSIVIGIFMNKWASREKVKAMRENAITAVQAVEQLFPTVSGERKKELAMTIAQNLNKTAGISVIDSTQLPLNEAGVLNLPSTKEPVKEPTESEALG
jgi:hypothetical protein